MAKKISSYSHKNHKPGTLQGMVRGLLETLLPGDPVAINVEGRNIRSIRVLTCNHALELGIKVYTRTCQSTGNVYFGLACE